MKTSEKISAGILMYSISAGKLKVFLAHPGGPYWRGKYLRAWDIPKGEVDYKNGEKKDEPEGLLKTAIREFHEETGISVKSKDLVYLNSMKTVNGKTVYIWAYKGTGNEKFVKSNLFSMEWPRGSGKMEKFPENDKAEYFEINEARKLIFKYAEEFLNKLEEKLNYY